MNILFYIGCFILYSLYGYICLTTIRDSKWFYGAGLALVIIANILWMTLVKRLNEPGAIVVAGVIWDAIIVSTIILVPVLMGIDLAVHKWVGLVIAAIGIGIALM